MSGLRRYIRRSIRRRLLAALMLMTLLTLGLSSLLSAVMDLQLFRDQLVRDLEVLSAVVADNCVSSLVFDDPQTAHRLLATLEREHQVRAARLLRSDGAVFARWDQPALGNTDGAAVLITQPIRFDGRTIGRLELDVSLDELNRQAWLYLLIGLPLALLVLIVALVVARGLQRRIAWPILGLAEQSRTISKSIDSARRMVDPDAGEEISTLVVAFNSVLSEKQGREQALASQARELDQANKDLRQLATDLSVLEQREKTRLATELHDGPLQKLALASLQIGGALRDGVASDDPRADVGLSLLREGIADLSGLQFDLSPPVLTKEGLLGALRWLAESTETRWGISMRCRFAAPLPVLDERRELVLFQCARELVNNLVKHAGAGNGLIRLRATGDFIELLVEDDGIGFPLPGNERAGNTNGGTGLWGITERLDLLGGRVEIEHPDQGARVRVRLPMDDDHDGPMG